MDWLVLAIGAVFLICVIVGIYKGAIKIAVSLATTIVTLIIVVFATPFVAKLIEEKTPVHDMIKDQVVTTMAQAATSQLSGGESVLSEDAIRKALNAAGISEELLEENGLSVEDIANGSIDAATLEKYGVSENILAGVKNKQSEVEEAVEGAEIPKDLQIKAIEMADLPDLFKSMLSDNNNDEIYEKLGVETFAQYVGEFLSKLIIHVVAFLCTFILVTIILRAIVFALDIVSNLPVLGFINRLAGGAVGIVIALVIVWVLFIIITLLYVTSFGQEMYHTIWGNDILKALYEHNPIMKLATNFM